MAASSVNTESEERIRAIVGKHTGKRGDIIAILEDIQACYNYLPRHALEVVAEETGHPLVDLYGLATFYSAFSLEPRGEHVVSVCMGTACHVRGAQNILTAFEKKLDVPAGKTTEDRSFTLSTVNCLGACALGPVAVIDGQYCRAVTEGNVPAMVEGCSRDNGEQPTGDPEETIHLHALCPHCNRSLMDTQRSLDGEPMIHVTVSFGDEHGWMLLSSTWGDQRIRSPHKIPDDTVVNFFCPQCHGELRSPVLCPACDAPTIPLLNKKGGIIQFCSRRGCPEHMFDLT